MRRLLRSFWSVLLSLGTVCCASSEVPRCVCLRPQFPEPAAPASSGVVRLANETTVAETQLDCIDILLAFDASAANWVQFSGNGSVDAYAHACIDKMNECLRVSDLLESFRFRLAGTVCIDQDFSGRSLDDVLDKFVDAYGRNVARGACAAVPAARDEFGADVVSILVANGRTGTVGVGYSLQDNNVFSFSRQTSSIVKFAPWAYNVCSIQAVDEDYTLLHEIGHNMGAGHPDETCASEEAFTAWEWDFSSSHWVRVVGGNLGPQLYGYSSGYYFWVGNEGYYTVMAYNHGGLDANGGEDDSLRFKALPYFSSPGLRFQDVPVGTVVNDNRQTLLNSFRYVAQFRASKQAFGSGRSTAITVAGFTVEGAFRPAKAVNARDPYVGVAYSNDVPVAVVQLKLGKTNAKTGRCKVSGSIRGIDGGKYAIQSLSVSTGQRPQRANGFAVKKFGTLDLVLGANGFAGTCASSPFGALEIRTHSTGAGLASNPASFRIVQVAEFGGLPVLVDCLPDRERVSTARRWVFAKNAKVKFEKVKGTSPVQYRLVIDEGRDGTKTNRSGLKLTYAAKTSSFKGSFSFLLRAGTESRPKVKKVKAAVTGLVVDGLGFGRAIVKGKGSWPVTIE